MPSDNSIVQAPSISEKAFNCPHCGALAKQFWYSTRVDSLKDDSVPLWLSEDEYKTLSSDIKDEDQKSEFLDWAQNRLSLRPFLHFRKRDPYSHELGNVHVAQCYNCKQVSIWFGQGIVWPARGSVEQPNSDIPPDALRDYEEAAAIVDRSTRGAAALLRLAIQKLCVHLGGSGKNINDDIAELVNNGLDARVRQALDVVRVVGNNAVHPGEMEAIIYLN